jgi:hypothetical protein
MPYTIKKSGKGYFVVNQNTGKKYSNKPITKTNADRQLKVLEMHSRGELGGEFDNINPDELTGGGLADFLKSAYKKISNTVSSVFTAPKSLSDVGERIMGFVSGRGDDYPPNVRDIIKQYGEYKVVGVSACRQKLSGVITGLVNVISLGDFNKVKNDYNIDDLNHLFMVVSVQDGDNVVPILVEKNEVINMVVNPTINAEAQKLNLVISPNFKYTFNQLLNNCRSFMGKDYFVYDALTNNCQRFIKSFILSNPPLEKDNPKCLDFVVQDITPLNRELSSSSKNLFRGVTDLAARFNVLAKGKGFDNSKPEHRFSGSNDDIDGLMHVQGGGIKDFFDASGGGYRDKNGNWVKSMYASAAGPAVDVPLMGNTTISKSQATNYLNSNAVKPGSAIEKFFNLPPVNNMGDNINESFLHQFVVANNNYENGGMIREFNRKTDDIIKYNKTHPHTMSISGFFKGLAEPFPGFNTIDVIKKAAEVVEPFI